MEKTEREAPRKACLCSGRVEALSAKVPVDRNEHRNNQQGFLVKTCFVARSSSTSSHLGGREVFSGSRGAGYRPFTGNNYLYAYDREYDREGHNNIGWEFDVDRWPPLTGSAAIYGGP